MAAHRRAQRARIEVRPGEGGEDAVVFANELVAAIRSWLRRQGQTVPEVAGDGRTIALDVPAAVAAALGPFAGTHRVQREPRNGKGKRHTSTATVAVLSGGGSVREALDPADVDEEVFRGTGPGGQHRNKTASDVRLVHRPTGVVVVESGRSQWQNRQRAWSELERRLVAAAEERRAGEVNQERRRQVTADRAAKGWTWNDQRDEVTDHHTGRTHRMRKMLAGRLPLGAAD